MRIHAYWCACENFKSEAICGECGTWTQMALAWQYRRELGTQRLRVVEV